MNSKLSFHSNNHSLDTNSTSRFAMATYAHLYSPYGEHPRRVHSLGKVFAWVHIESHSIWLLLATHLILFLLGAILGIFAPSRNTHEPTVKWNDLGSTPIPEHVFLPRIPTVMTPNDQYIGWNSASNENWMLLLHGKLILANLECSCSLTGWNMVGPGESVWIPNASEYGLGEGFSSPFRSNNGSDQTKSFYHISSLHQLHCLVSSPHPYNVLYTKLTYHT